MSGIRFGGLEPQHRGRIAEILAATGSFTGEEIDVALSLLDATADGYEFLGAFDATDTLVAYACYGPTPGTDGTFDLYWIAVHPSVQGAGEGSRLLGEVERGLRARAARLLVAETSSRTDYAPTRRFYERRGYREVARVADFYAPADDRVIYAKRLTPKATSADRPSSTH
jgi:ribosomal protein S18 acetylase RimI-like enzyme